jgi:fumarate reductase (CoM/CoB) subunit A
MGANRTRVEQVLSSDVWVIGSGAAGLTAAIAARRQGASVAVVGKEPAGQGTATSVSGGGFVGAWGGLTAEEHRDRTLQAGRGLNEPHLVEALVEDAPARFQDLIDWGLEIVETCDKGSLIAEGRGPERGEEITRCLVAKCHEVGVTFHDGLVARTIRAEDDGIRMVAYSATKDSWFGFVGGALVMAAGGAPGLYLRHDTDSRICGDAYAMALEAGAPLQDMEFNQFFPLCLAEPGLPPARVPPPVADLGRLVNTRGEDVLAKHGITERPAARRARDRTSQALFHEIEKEGQDVFVDLTDVTKDAWCADPANAGSWDYLGHHCGAWQRPLRVAPVAHFTMGGLCIDAQGATPLPGLYAAGEAAGGAHGANRMGENSLTETVVFGHRAGEAAAQRAAASNGTDSLASRCAELLPAPESGRPQAGISELESRLHETMWTLGGIQRNRDGLETGLTQVQEIAAEANKWHGIGEPAERQRFIELQMATTAALLILEAAKRREESRGAHYRDDFPKTDDQIWLGHLKVVLRQGEPEWSFDPRAKMD